MTSFLWHLIALSTAAFCCYLIAAGTAPYWGIAGCVIVALGYVLHFVNKTKPTKTDTIFDGLFLAALLDFID